MTPSEQIWTAEKYEEAEAAGVPFGVSSFRAGWLAAIDTFENSSVSPDEFTAGAPLQPREVVSSQATGWFDAEKEPPKDYEWVDMCSYDPEEQLWHGPHQVCVIYHLNSTTQWSAWDTHDSCVFERGDHELHYWMPRPARPDAPAALSEAESTEQQTESAEEGVEGK